MNTSTLTIKHRLILALIVAVLSATALVTYISQDRARQVVEHRLLQKEMPSTLLQIRNTIDKEVSLLLSAAEQLAKDQFILRASSPTGMTADDESLLLNHLQSIKDQYGVNDVSFADRESHFYWTQDGLLRQLNQQQDGWFFNFINSGKPQMLSLYEEDGVVKLYVNYQQLQGRGLSALAKKMDEMQAFINQFRLENSGFVYLTDSQGQIQLHSDTSLISKELATLYSPRHSATLLAENNFNLTEVERDGETVLLASSYIPSIGWYVVAELPKHEAFTELNSALSEILLWTAAITLLLLVIAIPLAGKLTQPINYLADVFKQLGEGDGDLNYRIDVQRQDEIGKLSEGFNNFIAKIHRSVKAVANTGVQLSDTATTVAEQAQQTLDNTQSQQSRTQQLAVAIEQMAATINEIAGNATHAADTALAADKDTDSGQQIVGQTSSHIKQLANDMNAVSEVISSLANNSQAIGSILDVIRGISEQTNLLALNAAIEAARAGEQGRGFAVVADEVRSLASRTAASTDEIQQMINQLQTEADNAVNAMSRSSALTDQGVTSAEEANQALDAITQRISEISDLNTQVATATEEQSTVVVDINSNIENINDISDHTASTATSMAQSSQQLQRLSRDLSSMVSEFKL